MGPARAKLAASGKIANGEKRRANSAATIKMAIGEKRGRRFRKKDGTIAVYPGGRHKRGVPRRRTYESKDAKISKIQLALEAAKKRITVLENENTALTYKEAAHRDLLLSIRLIALEGVKSTGTGVKSTGPNLPDVAPGQPPPKYSNLFADNPLQLPRPPPML